MARSAVIHVRVTPEQRESIRVAAELDNRSISAWCALYLASMATGLAQWVVR
jgi:uncharacterized protein (DUF1778 family)